MVCKPIPWESSVENPSTLSDLCGVYLSQPTGDIYRLLTSHNYSHFDKKLGLHYELMIQVMNILQSEPFEINNDVLSFIQNNRDRLVELGLLMPSFLASLNLKEASDILRKSYLEDDSIKNIYMF